MAKNGKLMINVHIKTREYVLLISDEYNNIHVKTLLEYHIVPTIIE